MKILKLFLILIIITSFTCYKNVTFAQDAEFTQFYANSLYLNPAFTGAVRCPRFVINYRNQWPGAGKYITYNFSYDQHIDKISGGIGLLVTRDVVGDGSLTTSSYGGIYSYQVPLTRKLSLKFGAQAAFIQKSLNWNKLNFSDQLDDRTGFVYNTQEVPGGFVKNNFDISAGAIAFSKQYFVGFAAHHLTEPDEFLQQGPSPLPRKYTAHAGAVIPLERRGNNSSISPNVIFQKQQDFNQLNLGFYLTKGPLVGGFWYRNQNSFILLLGFQQELFKFGYSYDITLNKFSSRTFGSHEISFAYLVPCKSKKKEFRTINYPSF